MVSCLCDCVLFDSRLSDKGLISSLQPVDSVIFPTLFCDCWSSDRTSDDSIFSLTVLASVSATSDTEVFEEFGVSSSVSIFERGGICFWYCPWSVHYPGGEFGPSSCTTILCVFSVSWDPDVSPGG